MKKSFASLLFFCILVLYFFPSCSSPIKEGGACVATKDCDTGLVCSASICKKSTASQEPTTDASNEKTPEKVAEKVSEVVAEKVTEKVAEKVSEVVAEKVTEKVSEVVAEKVTEKVYEANPDNEMVAEKVTEKVYEASPDNPTAAGVSLYDMQDPNSSKKIKVGDLVKVSKVVVTSPVARINSTLSTFSVQEETKQNGSYKYGGMMIIFDRTTYPSLNVTPGMLVTIEGKYLPFRSVDTKKTCTSDNDCAGNGTRVVCVDNYDASTGVTSKICGEQVETPQIELTTALATNGTGTVPTPEVVNIADVNSYSTTAIAYMNVLIQIENVEVTNKNPADPSDFSEWLVAHSTDKTKELAVDDLYDTSSYTGSKSCKGACSGTIDSSYCVSGQTCTCISTKDYCVATGSTTTLPDKRTVGDVFKSITGTFRFAFGSYRIQPRSSADLVQ